MFVFWQQVAFYGKASRVLDFFESIGLVCDAHFNPADFICEYTMLKTYNYKATMYGTDAVLFEGFCAKGAYIVLSVFLPKIQNLSKTCSALAYKLENNGVRK